MKRDLIPSADEMSAERLRELTRELMGGQQTAQKMADGKHHGDVWLRDGKTIMQAATVIQALAARLCEVEAANAWQPIETAPKTGNDLVAKPFIAYCPDLYESDRITICWWEPKINGGSWAREGDTTDFAAHPTRWRPLPAPPAATVKD